MAGGHIDRRRAGRFRAGPDGLAHCLTMAISRGSAARAVILSLVLCGLSYSCYVVGMVIVAPAQRRVQFVPDDAFYYLTLARNFVTQGQWTFDSGVSLTGGYHPLHAYTLAGLFALEHPSSERFVELGILVSAFAAVPAAVAAAAFALRSARLFPAILILLFLLSRNVSMNLVSAVEWGWVASLAGLYVLLLSRVRETRASVIWPALFAVGLTGSLARTDFGLLPAALLASTVFAVRSTGRRRLLASAAVGTGGVATGLAITLLHNALRTGQVVQSSARMKGLWTSVQGVSTEPFVGILLSLFGSQAFATRVLSGGLVVLALVAGFRAFVWPGIPGDRGHAHDRARDEAETRVIWLGSVLALSAYTAFYSANSAPQPWYTSCVMVPLFLAMSLPMNRSRPLGLVSLTGLTIVALLLGGQVIQARRFLSRPEWPHQASMYSAGLYLRDAALDGRVGSWNAGILGYYQGGKVVNLDGLVNNDIFPYARQNRLPEYIDAMSIRYIVDFEAMLLNEGLRRRGGYDVPSFLARLEPLRRFDDRTHGWRRSTLFRVNPVMVGSQPRGLPAGGR